MTPDEMKRRTRAFAVNVIRFVEDLPRGRAVDRVASQLVGCGTSIGANYRAACLARSKAEFTSKLQIALEEADESQYWLEVLREIGFSNDVALEKLFNEAKELTAIIMAGVKTARGLN